MMRLINLLIGLIKNYLILYFAWMSLGFIFQPISNIVALTNSFINNKVFSNKKEFYIEARRDIYTFISLIFYFITYFLLLVILESPFFAIILIMSYIIGVGIFVSPLPKKIRTNNYTANLFTNYLLPLLYWGTILISAYIILPHYF